MTSRTALLRMAQREVLRAKGRSALIILMILAPIAVMTFIDVTARTAKLSDLEALDHKIGAADAIAFWTSNDAVHQNVYGDWSPADPTGASAPGELQSPDIPALLPGSTIVTDELTSVRAKSQDGLAIMQFRMVDYMSPVATGIVLQKSGRAPQNTEEVVLSQHAVKRLGVKVGDALDISSESGPKRFSIVGTVETPGGLRQDLIIGLPKAIERAPDAYFETFHLVDTAIPLTWERVQQLNKIGVVVEDRTLLADPPPGSTQDVYDGTGGIGTDAAALLALLGGLAVMEICLLAGAAFAVGIRRQRRSLALLAATGGTSRQMRDVVLGMAVVLGLVASVGGVFIGVAAVLLGRPWLEQANGARFGQFEVLPRDIAIIALTGLVAALLSAVVPARTAARMDVTAALNGRRDAHANQRKWKLPAAGAVMALIGVALAAYGASRRDLEIVLVGAVFGELGLVFMTSVIIGFIGRFARLLPLGPRLALRDAVRNRTRTAPVVAAIMAAVAGSFAMSMYVSTFEVNDREQYTSEFGRGTVSVFGYQSDETQDPAVQIAEISSVLRSTLPVTHVGTMTYADSAACPGKANGCYVSKSVERIGENACPVSTASGATYARELRKHVNDPRCFQAGEYMAQTNSVVIGDAELVRALFGSNGNEAAKALADGFAIAPNRYDVSGGIARMRTSSSVNGEAETNVSTQDVPAKSFPMAERTNPPTLIVSASLAKELGVVVGVTQRVVASTERMPTHAEEDRAREALSNTIGIDSLSLEKGFQNRYGIGLLVLSIGTAILALMATGIAAGLALADGQADQGTLAAIGAGPRIRRFTSAFQAFVIASLGVGLGVLAGAIPGAGLAWIARYREFGAGVFVHLDVPWMDIIPWSTLATLLVAVPLVAAGFAWLFTRSRMPLNRRAT
jgi:putative ABC transport system permease protein